MDGVYKVHTEDTKMRVELPGILNAAGTSVAAGFNGGGNCSPTQRLDVRLVGWRLVVGGTGAWARFGVGR
jgi:hypothetical protein